VKLAMSPATSAMSRRAFFASELEFGSAPIHLAALEAEVGL
jgi:hypothetical protein